jgi:hypothetical protein
MTSSHDKSILAAIVSKKAAVSLPHPKRQLAKSQAPAGAASEPNHRVDNGCLDRASPIHEIYVRFVVY